MTATILATLMALVFSGWIWMLKHQMREPYQVLHAGVQHGQVCGHASHQIETHNRHPRHAKGPDDAYPIVELAPDAASSSEDPHKHHDERYARVNGVPTWTIT